MCGTTIIAQNSTSLKCNRREKKKNLDNLKCSPGSDITLVNVNTLVVATTSWWLHFFSTGGGVKGQKNLYLLTLLFIYKLAFILFVMTPGAQTIGNIAVYGSAKQLVI